MALARALSGPLTIFAPRHGTIQRCRNPASSLERVRAPAAEFRTRPDPGGPRSSDGIQNPEVRRIQESALAVDAAPGKPRNVSPGSGNHTFAAVGRPTDFDRPDAFLPRALVS